MHEDFRGLWHLLQYSIFRIVCDVKAITHCQSSFCNDLQVNVVADAHLADVAFAKADDS